jgi:hypothetical protein
MRLILGLVTTLALALGSAVVHAPSAGAAAAPDPAVVAALQAAAKESYVTAWRRDGGTFRERCTSPTQGDSVAITALDVKTRTKRSVYRHDGFTASVAVLRGRARYIKTSADLRRSLRVHGAPVPPMWSKRRGGVVEPGTYDDLWGDEDGPLAASASWAELTSAPLADGGTRFTGTTGPSGSTADAEWTTSMTAFADAGGRLVRVERHDEQRTHGGLVLSTRDCVSTWSSLRPRIAIPRHAPAARQVDRYSWEYGAVSSMVHLTWQANERLAAGATDAEVVAWLHTQPRVTRQLATGVRVVMVSTVKRRSRPPLAFRVTVRDGHASYRPVR